MLKSKLVLSIAASVLLEGGIASATTGKNFTGFYAGIHGGYGFGHVGHSYKPKNLERFTRNSFSLKGFVGGVHLGYQKELGRFVSGLEFFWGVSSRKTSHSFFEDLEGGSYKTISSSFKEKYYYGLAARFGFKATESIVPYIKLAYQRSRFAYVEHQKTVVVPIAITQSFSNKACRSAFAPGVGVDFLVSNNVMLGLEYTHAFYGKVPGSSKNKSRIILKPTTGTATLRLSYKF